MAAPARLNYTELTGTEPNLNDADYTVFPRLSDMVDVELSSNPPTPIKSKTPISNAFEMKISSPPSYPSETPPNPPSTKKYKKRRKKYRTPYINMRLSNIHKLFDKEQIYFACIAPLCSDHIDLHCKELKDLDLKYCCGLFMKIDRSFTIHTILSTEFITSLKKIILKKEDIAKKSVQLKADPAPPEEDSKNDGEYDVRRYVAFHPRDHWEFAKDLEHKNAVIFIHGVNYAPDRMNAAQFVMDECLEFYADMPYLVIPFIWPCEGELLNYDVNIIAEEYCGTELATFIRRLWSLFERIDFVAHGKGCNILLRAIKLLKKEKPDVIDMSHLVLIAADMDCNMFVNDYIDDIYRFVKRVTVYVNTWDWKLFSSKMWNWSNDRVGAMIMSETYDKAKKFDCIDVTQLLSGWFLTSNHYYLTNKYFKLDVIQALSKVGGVDPTYRNYVLPVYDDSSGFSDVLLADTVKYYELVDKPYMKVVPQKKQNERVNLEQDKKEEEESLEPEHEGDTKQPEEEQEQEQEEDDVVLDEKDMNTVAKNLQVLGYVDVTDQPEVVNDVELQLDDTNTTV
eukprot:238256_1